MRIGIDFSGTEIWYGVEQCSTRYSKPWPKWRVLIVLTIASCVVYLYKLCCLLFYCFKMNWGDSNIEKLIEKFYFQFHLVWKNSVRKKWYQFSGTAFRYRFLVRVPLALVLLLCLNLLLSTVCILHTNCCVAQCNVDMIFYGCIAPLQADILSIVCGGKSSWHNYVPKLPKHAGNVRLVESCIYTQIHVCPSFLSFSTSTWTNVF